MEDSQDDKTRTLGDEHDPVLREALRSVLAALGAETRSSQFALAGSQEIQNATVSIGGRELTIEIETYMGLSITGDPDLVDLVAFAVQKVIAEDAERPA